MKLAEITLPETAIRYIKRKGFTHIKVELEAHLNRSRSGESEWERCDNCRGSGYLDCEEDHGCDECDGGNVCPSHIEGDAMVTCDDASECPEALSCGNCDDGYIDCNHDNLCGRCDGEGGWNEDAPASMSDDYCKTWILNRVSQAAREAIVFSMFYYDGSVDSEFTFTLPIEASIYLPEFIRAFRELGDETGSFETHRAGMHIAILMDGNYPVRNASHDEAKLRNFMTQMKKLMPALFFLASPDHKSRELGFRRPQVSVEKYSAIHVLTGGFEYRVFETCYDRPEMILQFVAIIAKTLKFYGTTQVKQTIFNRFDFPETDNPQKAYLTRFYNTPEQLKALDRGLKYLVPDGSTVELLKAQRHFKPKFGGLYDEVQLRKLYIDYVAREKERSAQRIKNDMSSLLIGRNSSYRHLRELYDFQLNKDKLQATRKAIVQQNTCRPVNYSSWRTNYLMNHARPAITITAN